jgi:RNA polymerase sigma-70 factor, ECF subfamily
MNELEIIKAICAGGHNKELAMNALYHKKAPEFRRYLVRRGLSREQAEDLLQDTFFKIFLNANKFTGDSSFSANTWMWTIAKNRMRDHFKAERPGIDIPIDGDSIPDKEPNPADQTIQDCVTHGLEKFAEDHADRARVLEMQMDNENVTSIAQHINRTYGATREYLSQCKKVLQTYIEHCTPLLEP